MQLILSINIAFLFFFYIFEFIVLVIINKNKKFIPKCFSNYMILRLNKMKIFSKYMWPGSLFIINNNCNNVYL